MYKKKKKSIQKIENVPYFPLLKLPTTAYLIKQVKQTTIKWVQKASGVLLRIH